MQAACHRARSLHRAPSSISRELRRTAGVRRNQPPRRGRAVRCSLAVIYRAPLAQQRARHLAGTAQQPARLDPQGPLWATV
ncbi:MAG: hypothetical protein VB125_04640 [Burkholderia sp.]